MRATRAAWAIAVALGMLHAAAFSPPLQHGAVSIAALAGLFALMNLRTRHDDRPAPMAVLAFLFGLGWFGAGLAWLYVSMHVYGGMPSVMAAAAVVVFAAYLALYPAVATAVAWRVARGGGPLLRASTLAGAWTVGELARGWMFTGFPWLAPGYAQLDGPLDAWAPIAGVHLVGLVACGVAALIGAAIAGPSRWPPLAAAAAVVVASALLPADAWTRAHGTPLAVRLVQGNVAQEMKFRPERVIAAMDDYASRFTAGRATLTVLPETAWTVPWAGTPEPIARRILEHAARGHAIAIGMPLPAADDAPQRRRLANSVLLLTPAHARDPSQPAPRYDKRHLVPFGEFVPWGFGWFVAMMEIPLGEFARGAAGQPPFQVGDQRVAFNVCYEDLFGGEIREALPGPSGATVLANVSNIAWFGRSHALPQHLAIARMRTLETGRPMLRSTNTGVTAAIDASGRVIAQLPPYTAGEIDVMVQGTTGLTPFARFGDTPALIAGVLLVAAGALVRAGRRGRTR